MMEIISVHVLGHLDPYDSYGLVTCELLRNLDRASVFVNASASGDRQIDTQPRDIKRLSARTMLPSNGSIVLGPPSEGMLVEGKRVAVTMFESTRIPRTWAEILNQMDAVIVPSQFCYESFIESGVTPELMHLVPLGIGEIYQPIERSTERPLTFLAFMDRGMRKGGNLAIQAFVKAFGDRDDVKLLLKSRIARVPYSFTNSNIELIQEDMTEDELFELYRQCDVLINPHRGEGFGLIPREFAATGGIALTTAWSGTADCLDAWGYSLPYDLEPAKWENFPFADDENHGRWALPNIEAIADVLIEVDANIDHYREQSANKSATARHLYKWREFALGVLNVWESVK